MTKSERFIEKIIDDSVESIGSLRAQKEIFEAIAKEAISVLENGGTIFFAGNGGSAADSQHAAAELVGKLGLGVERTALRAIALTTDTSAITAIGNDFGFENIFSRQLEALGKMGDLFVGISTSGKSNNVLNALATAKKIGMKTVAIIGAGKNPSRETADFAISVSGDNTPQIQAGHSVALHILCALIEGLA
jgi:D-sedoheptulose 7-phosphate isomerase